MKNHLSATVTTKTTCPYCGVGCGVTASTHANGSTTIAGDETHPANRGRLCLKGQTLAETLSLTDRLLYPVVDGETVEWSTALERISDKFRQCIDTHGPESIAFYVSGQLLTEDYYVVNKFVKGYLGTANIDTNSRLCMASSVAGHKRAFGADTVPGCYEDLELADLVILVGSNLAWCHPVLHRRLTEAQDKKPRLKIVTIDTRSTATTELADRHLRINADTDTILFNGLVRYLYEHGIVDKRYIYNATIGLNELLKSTQQYNVTTVAGLTGLTEAEVLSFYNSYAATKKVVTVYSQGVNQSSIGTDKVNAIINCHLLTGRIGKQGCGPFSITGQPNAMGGRETGGLANMLTCHMDIENEFHRHTVKQFWNAPVMAKKPGLKAVDLFNGIDKGDIKAVWIMATNPAASMPDANFVASALSRCEFVVQSDVVRNNDTSPYAHVQLPAQAWGEKSGTVTNSERCISRQRRFRVPPGQTRPDWWAVAKVAQQLGFREGFQYSDPNQIFREFAELSGLNNQNDNRDFDISFYKDVDKQRYNRMEPFYWPARESADQKPIRFFAKGDFYTPDRRARFIVTSATEQRFESKQLPTNKGELLLNTGRTRDHWHTMTRTGHSPTLSAHTPEPFIEINAHDAALTKLKDADLAIVSNERGKCVLRVIITDRVAQGSVFVPIHWCSPFSNSGRIDSLTEQEVDPVSGQPALKHSTVKVARYEKLQYGFAITRERVTSNDFVYVATARCEGGWRTEFAVDADTNVKALVKSHFSGQKRFEALEYEDKFLNRFNYVVFDGSKLHSACFTADQPVAASRDWLVSIFTRQHNSKYLRHSLLSGVQPDIAENNGKLICTCFGIGEKQIIRAINKDNAETITRIGELTHAGTNCGSCRGELNSLIKKSIAVKSV